MSGTTIIFCLVILVRESTHETNGVIFFDCPLVRNQILIQHHQIDSRFPHALGKAIVTQVRGLEIISPINRIVRRQHRRDIQSHYRLISDPKISTQTNITILLFRPLVSLQHGIPWNRSFTRQERIQFKWFSRNNLHRRSRRTQYFGFGCPLTIGQRGIEAHIHVQVLHGNHVHRRVQIHPVVARSPENTILLVVSQT